jgi:hypothetical protein
VQLAGEWSGLIHLSALLKERIQHLSEPIRSIEQIAKLTRSALDEFKQSALYHEDGTYELLLSGFVLGVPAIIEAVISEDRPKVSLHDSCKAIGFGSVLADAIFTLRECHSKMRLSYSVYLAYEAKRASEKTGRVGQFTSLAIQYPHNADSKDRAQLAVMNPKGIANLDSLYRGVWKVPFATLPDPPADFFHTY